MILMNQLYWNGKQGIILNSYLRANGIKPKNSGELLKYVQELYPDLLKKYYDEIKKE